MKALDILPGRDKIQEMLAACDYSEMAEDCDAATPQGDPGWFIRNLRENRSYHFESDFIY